jgi:hypothetical protein
MWAVSAPSTSRNRSSGEAEAQSRSRSSTAERPLWCHSDFIREDLNELPLAEADFSLWHLALTYARL